MAAKLAERPQERPTETPEWNDSVLQAVAAAAAPEAAPPSIEPVAGNCSRRVRGPGCRGAGGKLSRGTCSTYGSGRCGDRFAASATDARTIACPFSSAAGPRRSAPASVSKRRLSAPETPPARVEMPPVRAEAVPVRAEAAPVRRSGRFSAAGVRMPSAGPMQRRLSGALTPSLQNHGGRFSQRHLRCFPNRCRGAVRWPPAPSPAALELAEAPGRATDA